MSAKFYDPQECVVYFNGNLLTGFGEDDFITVEQMTPAFSSVVGCDGEVARSKSSDRRVKVTITLLQTSIANAQLSKIHKTDIQSANGAGVGTFLFQDLQGGTIASADAAWINSFPSSAFGKAAKGRSWEIELAEGDRTEGGNP